VEVIKLSIILKSKEEKTNIKRIKDSQHLRERQRLKPFFIRKVLKEVRR